MFHPPVWVLVFFLVTSLVASLALALVFQLSHCVVETEFIDPRDRPETHSWQIHQIESTVDFAHENRLLRLYAGGLNHQIEHHLYSRLPHTLYPRIAPIVEAAARAHGITYTHHPTLRQALRSHTQWLKLMGGHPQGHRRTSTWLEARHGTSPIRQRVATVRVGERGEAAVASPLVILEDATEQAGDRSRSVSVTWCASAAYRTIPAAERKSKPWNRSTPEAWLSFASTFASLRFVLIHRTMPWGSGNAGIAWL